MQKNIAETQKRHDPYKLTICKYCGKEFIKAPIPVLGNYCKPTCKLKADREHEELMRQRGVASRRRLEAEKRKKTEGKFSSRRNLFKPVNQFTIDGEFVARYESIKCAAQAVNVSDAGISQCLRGCQKTSAGFVWKYEEKEQEDAKKSNCNAKSGKR